MDHDTVLLRAIAERRGVELGGGALDAKAKALAAALLDPDSVAETLEWLNRRGARSIRGLAVQRGADARTSFCAAFWRDQAVWSGELGAPGALACAGKSGRGALVPGPSCAGFCRTRGHCGRVCVYSLRFVVSCFPPSTPGSEAFVVAGRGKTLPGKGRRSGADRRSLYLVVDGASGRASRCRRRDGFLGDARVC